MEHDKHEFDFVTLSGHCHAQAMEVIKEAKLKCSSKLSAELESAPDTYHALNAWMLERRDYAVSVVFNKNESVRSCTLKRIKQPFE